IILNCHGNLVSFPLIPVFHIHSQSQRMSKTISPVHSKKTNRLVNRTETVRRIEKILTYMKSFTKLRHSELHIQIIPHFRMVVQPSEYRCENLRSTADLLRAGVNPSHHSCSQRIFFPETDQYI